MTNDGTYFPQALENNYWEQGDTSFAETGITETGNTIISGPKQAPAALVAAAGLEPAFHSLLNWIPAPAVVPNPPEKVTALYAYHGRAYLTWHPSFAEGSSPVKSYTVTGCQVRYQTNPGLCVKSVRPVKISSADLDHTGYAVIHGLSDGKPYSFSVSANNTTGASPSSIPSAVVIPTGHAPNRPDKPGAFVLQPGVRSVRLLWYPAASTQSPTVFGVKLDPGEPRAVPPGCLHSPISDQLQRPALQTREPEPAHHFQPRRPERGRHSQPDSRTHVQVLPCRSKSRGRWSCQDVQASQALGLMVDPCGVAAAARRPPKDVPICAANLHHG